MVAAGFLASAVHAQILTLGPTLGPTPGPPWNVDSAADEVDLVPGDGYCWTYSGHCTLRAAIQEANTHPGTALQKINVPQNRYFLMLPDSLHLLANMEIVGAGMYLTDIRAANSARIFDTPRGITVLIRGVGLQYGQASYPEVGGAILNAGDMTILDCYLAHNAAYSGGAVANTGTLNIQRSKITNNIAVGLGGAILSRISGSRVRLTDTLLYDNVASLQGGAIWTENTAVVIERSTLAGNSSMLPGAMCL